MEEKEKNTFPKKEHLYGNSAVTELFQKGKTFLSYPVKITYKKVTNDAEPVRCLVHAPKKKFKHAVDRNHVKRQLREAYRKHKQGLAEYMKNQDFQLHFSMLYVDERILPSHVMEKKIENALKKLQDNLNK